jgi:predicted nucleic acid-binding Zn ribbon protein
VLAECPDCGRRVQILHAFPEQAIFKCSGCHSLAYTGVEVGDGRVVSC